MKIIHTKYAAFFLFPLSLLFSEETVVFEDNFNEQTLNQPPSVPWTSVIVTTSNANVVEDEHGWFDQGGSNRVLEILKDCDDAGLNLRALNVVGSADASTLNSFRFSLYQPSNPGFDVSTGVSVNAYTSGFAPEELLGRVIIGLSNGRVINNKGRDWLYRLDQTNHFELIFNTSESSRSVVRDGITRNIPASSFAPWINGVFQGVSSLGDVNTTGEMTSFQLVYSSNGLIKQYIDDFVVTAIKSN